MRLSLEEIMENLGVDHVMSPYETQPWMHYDEDAGITCSAEVRMGPACENLETEVQFLHDHGETIVPEPEEGENGDDQDEDMMERPKQNPIIDGREQILIMRIMPAGDGTWGAKALNVKGKEYANAFHDWENKGCEIFRNIIECLQMGELPDIDALTERILQDDSKGGRGRRGRIGRKSPKVNQQALLGMKKGM